MKFILSQELSRHNRDKKCSPIEPRMDYKTYEISYETIEILPSYTIITPSETPTVPGSEIIASVSAECSEILVIPPMSHEPSHQGNDITDDIGTVKSWNCGLCAFRLAYIFISLLNIILKLRQFKMRVSS